MQVVGAKQMPKIGTSDEFYFVSIVSIPSANLFAPSHSQHSQEWQLLHTLQNVLLPKSSPFLPMQEGGTYRGIETESRYKIESFNLRSNDTWVDHESSVFYPFPYLWLRCGEKWSSKNTLWSSYGLKICKLDQNFIPGKFCRGMVLLTENNPHRNVTANFNQRCLRTLVSNVIWIFVWG